jgi:hypothetical protein
MRFYDVVSYAYLQPAKLINLLLQIMDSYNFVYVFWGLFWYVF